MLLRVVRKAKWIENDELHWLPKGEVQGDALSDLRSTDNKLSLYLIDANDSSQHHQVAIALAATREHVAHIDYALVDPTFLAEIGIKLEKTVGDTPDNRVNDWHHDLVNLTARQVIMIANHIAEKQAIYRLLPNNSQKSDKLKQGKSIRYTADVFGVHFATLYRYLR